MTMRGLLKRPVERALSSYSVGRLTRQRVRGRRLILAYHGVSPDGAQEAGERALFVSQSAFAAQMEMLAEVADVAPLDQIDEEGDGRPRVAVTLDDAYAGALNHGVPELVKRTLPATIFVAPGCLEHHVFWWDALAMKSGELDDRTRHYALSTLDGSESRIRAWAARESISVSNHLPPHARAGSLEELRRATTNPLITLGSHSWSHVNLANLALQDIVNEIVHSRAWLQQYFVDRTINWLAYPYGLDSLRVHEAARRAEYKGALRIDGGWHRANEVSAFARPRFNVSAGLSVDGLKARVVGALLS